MNKTLLLSFLFFLSIGSLYGQKNMDFILTIKGDTLFGKIKFTPFEDLLIFKHRRKRFSFHPKALTYFGVYRDGNYQHYKSIKPNGEDQLFAKVMDEGKINLYFYQHIDKRYPPPHIRRLYFIGPTDNALGTISTRSYGPVIKYMFKDHPSLSQKAENASFESVATIVSTFNRL